MSKNHGWLKASTAAALCAALVLLSPGLDCYAAAGSSLNAPVTDGGTPTTGKVGNSGVSLIQVNPASLKLSPASLSGSLKVFSGAPTVVRGVQAAPAAPAPALAAFARTENSPAQAAPAKAAPAASAQAVLTESVRQISQARDSTGRQQALDLVFTGGKSKADSGDIPMLAAPGQAFNSGLAPARPGADDNRSQIVPLDATTTALAKAKVFITRANQAPVATSLAELPRALAAEPALKASLNQIGRIRVVLSRSNPHGGLAKADVAQLQQALAGVGITAKVEVENIPIDWDKDAKTAPAGPGVAAAESKPAEQSPLQRYLIGPVTRPFRDLAYLGRAFAASYTTPTLREFVAGVAIKLIIPLLVLKQIGWIAMYNGHPVAKALALGVSLGLQVFHGIFVSTWSNLQNNIGKQRGVNFQTIFNLVYGQWWGVIFRTIAWSSIPKTIPPWSYKYWKDMGIQTIAGTFFGTLGYQGLNTLYNNGRLNQWQRGAIFLFRDLVMCLTGTFFGSGSMAIFWTVFIAQQLMDLGIYAFSRSRWAKRRPIVYIADDMVAATPEFQGMYPVQSQTVEQESPLKQALKNILSVPLFKPIVWAAKKAYGRLKGKPAVLTPSVQG